MKKFAEKKLSLIIPCFKQAKTIVKDLKKIKEELDKIRYHWEMIVIIDGRVDKTYQKAKKLRSTKIKIYQLKENQGKGNAVRFGMKKAKGDYIAFLDAGGEIDPSGISMLLEHLEWYDADIIVGCKRHLVSQVAYPLERKILSLGYYFLVKILFGIKVRDTQAGIKVFKRKVLEKTLPLLLVKKYAFDIEILSVANQLGFQRIYEAPIKLNYFFSSLSNAATLKQIANILVDTLAVFYRLRILKYYSKTKQQRKR